MDNAVNLPEMSFSNIVLIFRNVLKTETCMLMAGNYKPQVYRCIQQMCFHQQ